MTDFNGWQTAYGYDDGASRPRFESSVRQFRDRPRRGAQGAHGPRETRAAERDPRAVRPSSWRSTTWRTRALQRGDDARVKRIFLGPELRALRRRWRAARSELARYEARGATATEKAFDDAREDSRRGLIAVALGAALVIVLLLVTAADIARLAIEGHRVRE